MSENEEKKLQELILKISQLTERQQQIQKDLVDIQRDVYNIKREEIKKTEVPIAFPQITENKTVTPEPIIETPSQTPKKKQEDPVPLKHSIKKELQESTRIEDFIGSNLLNKIGIAILVLGIGYGVKYSIDHDLLNPLTRVILGYLSGAILIGLALKLKEKYATFSAVLLSGGMAATYFITYAAYDFYGFFPQPVAFALMVMFTVFTVVAALNYNLQVIAVIGLVGAYGVPFLLSDGSGRVVILFSYMCIINAGILTLAFKKYWSMLYYLAFFLTWLIFAVWWVGDYSSDTHLWSSLIFSSLFFVIFYSTFLAYKLLREENFDGIDLVMLLLNSFTYFALGYLSIDDHQDGSLYLGLFTTFNAALHFIACLVIYIKKDQYKDVFYFVAGLVIVFLTIAVPVQLDGNWVTLIWAAEAVMMFYLGRIKTLPIYEKISYPIILIAFTSLLQDWNTYYNFIEYTDTESHPFLFNIQFLTSLLVIAAFTSIVWLNQQTKYSSPFKKDEPIRTLFNAGMVVILSTSLYFMFYNEIQSFWEQKYFSSTFRVPAIGDTSEYTQRDPDIREFETLWLINYSAFFGLAMSLVLIRFIRNKVFTFANVAYNVMVIVAFVAVGLASLAALRESYISQDDANVYVREMFNHIGIRYLSLLFILPLIWVNRKLLRNEYFTAEVREIEKILLQVFVIVLLSSELVNWLDILRVDNSDKLALTILWGLYALGMIVWGLGKDDKTLRIVAISLFGLTITKLFVYDITDMSTIAKTVVMMTLGALLLIASFLYNRVKKSRSDEK